MTTRAATSTNGATPPPGRRPGRRTGRRPGDSGTRDAILAAAAKRFAEGGFRSTTIRAIAGDAGVDPALVIHYFTSKQALFQEAMQIPSEPMKILDTVLAEGTENLGPRLVAAILSFLDELGPANPMLGLLRSATADEQAARTLSEFVRLAILSKVTRHLGVDQPMLRAELCSSQILGAILVTQVLQFPEMREAGREVLVAMLGGTLQHYLSDPLPVIEPAD